MAEIKWHDSAREHLRKIFDFNYNNMSEKYAYVRQNPQTLIQRVVVAE